MRTILIVDDDAGIREVLGNLLEQAGYGVLQAGNGLEALQHLEGGLRPSLIILDLNMPVMDGAVFRAEQERRPEIAGIPVVLLSGESELAAKAGLLRATAYAAKPVDCYRLLRLIEFYCGPEI